MKAAFFCNLAVVIGTFLSVQVYFRARDGKTGPQNGLHAFRYFTTLSNVFAGITSLILLIRERPALSGQTAALTDDVLFLKFLSTTAVMVTLLTVLFFLGPSMGYGFLLAREGLYLHLIGPLLCFAGFCFLEKGAGFPKAAAFAGLLPTALYGAVYLYQVVLKGEERGGWEDFYGFNKGGKWPVSIAAMLTGTLLIALVVLSIHNHV